MKVPTLWQKLAAFEFDSGLPELSFAQRLARENQWDLGFAARAIEEYKRFLYLAAVAGHPVTPSDEVDQVWHLHLTYTRSYWEKLCGEILEKPMHHNPTRGGMAEDLKFRQWYERTKETYEAEFDQKPPEEVWPASETRFSQPRRLKEPNTADFWVISKRKFGQGARVAAVVLGALLMVAACGGAGDGMDIGTFFGGFITVMVVLFIIGAKYGGHGGGGKGGGGASCGGGISGCSCGGSGCSGGSGCGGGGGCGGGS
jgi:hypothetical protein